MAVCPRRTLAACMTYVLRPEVLPSGTSKPALAGSEPRSLAPAGGDALWPGKANSTASA